MSETPFATHAQMDRNQAEPFEVGVVHWVRKPGEGAREELSAGYWFITPEEAPDPMEIEGHADEVIHIVEGRVRIQLAGQEAFEVAAGGSATLNKGTVATWTVLEPTIEFFVYA